MSQSEEKERNRGTYEAGRHEPLAAETVNYHHEEKLGEGVGEVEDADEGLGDQEAVLQVEREDDPNHVGSRVTDQHRCVDRKVPPDHVKGKEGHPEGGVFGKGHSQDQEEGDGEQPGRHREDQTNAQGFGVGKGRDDASEERADPPPKRPEGDEATHRQLPLVGVGEQGGREHAEGDAHQGPAQRKGPRVWGHDLSEAGYGGQTQSRAEYPATASNVRKAAKQV